MINENIYNFISNQINKKYDSEMAFYTNFGNN